jgi:hypothetical protein
MAYTLVFVANSMSVPRVIIAPGEMPSDVDHIKSLARSWLASMAVLYSKCYLWNSSDECIWECSAETRIELQETES